MKSSYRCKKCGGSHFQRSFWYRNIEFLYLETGEAEYFESAFRKDKMCLCHSCMTPVRFSTIAKHRESEIVQREKVMNELRPCSFCYHEAEYYIADSINGKYCIITCSECGGHLAGDSIFRKIQQQSPILSKNMGETCNGCKAVEVDAFSNSIDCALGYATEYNENLEMLPKERCQKPSTMEEYTQCLKAFYEEKIKTNPESMLNATCVSCGRQLFGALPGDPGNWLVLNKEYTKGLCFDCGEFEDFDKFSEEKHHETS